MHLALPYKPFHEDLGRRDGASPCEHEEAKNEDTNNGASFQIAEN